MTRKLYLRTFGCQMNSYDSDRMADLLAGAEDAVLTDDPEEADIVLFNTCSIREKAQEKVFSYTVSSKKLMYSSISLTV